MIIATFTVGPDAPESSLNIGAVFDEHGAFLMRNVRRWVPNDADVDDVVQDVFLIANQKKHDLDPAGNVRAWLYGVARNVVRHRQRSHTRRQRAHDAMGDWGGDASPLPDEATEQMRNADLVRSCVRALSPALRDVFVLFELEGESGADIAAVLGIREDAVWTRLSRARAKFREAFSAANAKEGAHGKPRAMAG